MRNRDFIRKINFTKAARKRNIANHIYGFDWYDNLHQYSKNKIHCSCPMCRRNDKYSISEYRKLDSMNNQMNDCLGRAANFN